MLMSLLLAPFKRRALLIMLAAGLLGCSPETSQQPRVVWSDPQLCAWQQNLQEWLADPAASARELRLLNEQWHGLQQDSTTPLLSYANYTLGQDTVKLLRELNAIVTTTRERVGEFLDMNGQMPNSIKRELTQQLNDCCSRPLQANANALLHEPQDSALYQAGRMAYYAEARVNDLINGRLTVAEYEAQLATLEQTLTAAKPNLAPAPLTLQCMGQRSTAN